MMGLCIALAVIVLLAFLPIGIRLSYDEAGGFVWLKIGFIKLKLYPQDKTGKAKEDRKQSDNHGKKGEKKAKDGSLTDFLPIVRVVLDFLSDFRRRLWVQNLRFQLVLAADDPCDLAVHYGEAWAAVGGLFPLLEQYVKIKKRNIEVLCDFTAEQTKVVAYADIRITLGRFLQVALRHGLRGFKEYQKLSKKIKAVQ